MFSAAKSWGGGFENLARCGNDEERLTTETGRRRSGAAGRSHLPRRQHFTHHAHIHIIDILNMGPGCCHSSFARPVMFSAVSEAAAGPSIRSAMCTLLPHVSLPPLLCTIDFRQPLILPALFPLPDNPARTSAHTPCLPPKSPSIPFGPGRTSI